MNWDAIGAIGQIVRTVLVGVTLGKWALPKQSPLDIVMRISPEYLEMPYYD